MKFRVAILAADPPDNITHELTCALSRPCALMWIPMHDSSARIWPQWLRLNDRLRDTLADIVVALREVLEQPPSRRWCILVLIVAAVLRLSILLMFHGLEPMKVESQRVAVSLVETGHFGAAFWETSGPTAHLGVMTPLLTAAAYFVFGVETPLAELALSIIAIALTFCTYILASQCLGLLGVPWAPRALGLLFLLFFPMHLRLEIIEGRYWEMLPATCALLAVLRHVLRRNEGETPLARELVTLGAISGFVFILSPPTGLACMGLIAILTIRKAKLVLWPVPALASLVLIATLALPWAARNQSTLGHPVWLRSNFGLELALANHDMAVELSPRTAFLARFEQIHPVDNRQGLQAMRAAGGEIEYNRQLLNETKEWVAGNPGSFGLLSVRRLRQYLVPPPWIRFPWSEQRDVFYLVSLLSLIGLGAGTVRLWRNSLYWYVAAAVLIPALPYMLVQPVYRYRYLISSLLVLLAFDVVCRRFLSVVRSNPTQGAQ